MALTEFAPSYHRATVTQVSLASVGFLSALAAWRLRSDARWLIGGGLLVSVIPFTALAMLPTNKKLLDPETANDLGLAEKLLTRWGNPLWKATCGKERLEFGFAAVILVPGR